MFVAEVEPFDPPNQAPLAANDTATTDEDTPVMIPVLSNDSDPDGDDLDVWLADAATPNGKVEAYDGLVFYTPDPDFHGTDTFSYTTLDGSGGSAQATVTVTVNSVNDEPYGFNDVYAWNVTYPLSQPLSVPAAAGVLANDIDYDNVDPSEPEALTAILANPPFEGSLTFTSDGSFNYEPPDEFYGEVTFVYYAQDSGGVSGSSATVTLLICEQLPEPPPFQAVDDAFPVGQDPAGDGVLANDEGGILAVVRSHPGDGKLTFFDPAGTFAFEPYYSFFQPGVQTFIYTLFTADGRSQDASVTLYPVYMDISNGQGGPPVPPKNVLNPGAFTVVNFNDTDGDGVTDFWDDVVKTGAGSLPGSSNEIDLMKLTILPPLDPNPGGNKVKLSFWTGGNVRLWKKATKEEELTLAGGGGSGHEFTVAELQQQSTYYIEATGWSNSLRDIEIKVEYRGASYKINATAIWAEMTAFLHTNESTEDALPSELDKKEIRTYIRDQIKTLGVVDKTTGSLKTKNAMVMEFKLRPPGIGGAPGIIFDISRSKERKAWTTTGATRTADEAYTGPFNLCRDNPNDDSDSGDEDNNPTNDRIYSFDAPGRTTNVAGFDRDENRANFVEFVRVKTDGTPFADVNGDNTAPAVQGSRASLHVEWRVRMDLLKDTDGLWKRNITPGENEIELEHKALGN